MKTEPNLQMEEEKGERGERREERKERERREREDGGEGAEKKRVSKGDRSSHHRLQRDQRADLNYSAKHPGGLPLEPGRDGG